jgi:hypothetical protein
MELQNGMFAVIDYRNSHFSVPLCLCGFISRENVS